MGKTLTSQFEILVDFIERNGEVHCQNGSELTKIQRIQKWYELVGILNKAPGGERKSSGKWKKAWSDFKNNTKKKAIRLRTGRCSSTASLTPLEKRVLKLVGFNHSTSIGANKEVPKCKVERTSESSRTSIDMLEMPPSNHYFVFANNDMLNQTKSPSPQPLLTPITSPPPSKNNHSNLNEEFKEITERYFDYERERNRMSHELEMARIKQNERLLSVLDRVVNVVERIAPSIQRYFDRESNGKG